MVYHAEIEPSLRGFKFASSLANAFIADGIG
jgi:hypothetical protein